MDVPADLRDRYVERRKHDLEVCQHSLADHNFHELERVGHQLKGNGITFGFSELSLIGRSMEGAAATRDLEQLKQALKEFSRWIHQHLN